MTTPHEKFDRFVVADGRSNAALGRALGVTGQMVHHIRSGLRSPGLDLAVGIERLTVAWVDGAIRSEEWVDAKTGGAADLESDTKPSKPEAAA